MTRQEKIDYIEFPSTNLNVTKNFFSKVFGWSFENFGNEYMAIHNAGLDGGFFKSDKIINTDNGSALVVLYSSNLLETQSKIELAGGTIKQKIFSFPGGQRFHFTDPTGNEYAVWSDQ